MIYVVPLISFAVFLQSIEHLLIQRSVQNLDPWGARDSDATQHYLYYVLILRACLAAMCILWPEPLALAFLFLSTYLIGVRYRGTFNGGSDSMTLHILGAAVVYKYFPAQTHTAGAYVAVLISASYFFAGLAKINSKSWRDGLALPRFLFYSNSAFPNRFEKVMRQSPRLLGVASVAIITFEVLFPLSLLSPAAAMFFLPVGILFHLANYYFFGLNRFFWTWVAGYPAIWFWVSR